MQNEHIAEEFILCQFIEPVKKSIKSVNTENGKRFVRIVEGLEFVNTEKRNHNVRIVEGLLFVNKENIKQLVRIVEGK